MIVFDGSNYEQSSLEILENMIPEAVSDAEMILHARDHDMGWQKKVNCGWIYRTHKNNDTAADLFTEGVHHRNINVVFITQNFFTRQAR